MRIELIKVTSQRLENSLQHIKKPSKSINSLLRKQNKKWVENLELYTEASSSSDWWQKPTSPKLTSSTPHPYSTCTHPHRWSPRTPPSQPSPQASKLFYLSSPLPLLSESPIAPRAAPLAMKEKNNEWSIWGEKVGVIIGAGWWDTLPRWWWAGPMLPSGFWLQGKRRRPEVGPGGRELAILSWWNWWIRRRSSSVLPATFNPFCLKPPSLGLDYLFNTIIRIDRDLNF